MEPAHQEGRIPIGIGVVGFCLPQAKKYTLVICEAGFFLWEKSGQRLSLSPRGHQASACLAELLSSFSDFDWSELIFSSVPAYPSLTYLLGLGYSCDQPSLLEVPLFVGWSFGIIDLYRTALWLRIGPASGTGTKVA